MLGWSGLLGEPTTLIFVRHGETLHTADKKFSGPGGDDPGLNDDGWAQAERAAAALAATAASTRSSPRRCSARVTPRRRSRGPGLDPVDRGRLPGVRVRRVGRADARPRSRSAGRTSSTPGSARSRTRPARRRVHRRGAEAGRGGAAADPRGVRRDRRSSWSATSTRSSCAVRYCLDMPLASSTRCCWRPPR